MLPKFIWSIVNAETREVVQESSVVYRSMEVAFAAAGPALREWMNRSLD